MVFCWTILKFLYNSPSSADVACCSEGVSGLILTLAKSKRKRLQFVSQGTIPLHYDEWIKFYFFSSHFKTRYQSGQHTEFQVERSGFKCWPSHCIVFLSKKFSSQSTSLHPCEMWKVKSEVVHVKCYMWSAICEVWNLKWNMNVYWKSISGDVTFHRLVCQLVGVA